MKLRVGKGEWSDLKKTREKDPYYLALRDAEAESNSTGLPMGGGSPSDHLWKGPLPAKLSPGVHLLEAVTKDMYGREFRATRVLRIE